MSNFYNDDVEQDPFMDDYDDGRIHLDDPEELDIPLDNNDFEDSLDDDVVVFGATPLQKIKYQIDNLQEYQRKPMKFKVIGTRNIISGVPMRLVGATKCIFKDTATDRINLYKLDDITFVD